MVWIYGGGFQVGEATRDMYSPDFFMSKDVVLVSISYRLGALGFLSLEDPELNVPGNAGLKDQILGLRWVQQNIEAFGGDPNNVTLFGECRRCLHTSADPKSPDGGTTAQGHFDVRHCAVSLGSTAEQQLGLSFSPQTGLHRHQQGQGDLQVPAQCQGRGHRQGDGIGAQQGGETQSSAFRIWTRRGALQDRAHCN